MKHDIEALQSRLRATLLSGGDTATLRRDIARLESEQRDAAAQVARNNADLAASVDEAVTREARARATASANRLKNLLTHFQSED